MQVKTYQELYKQMCDYLIAHQNEVTDFNEGSVITSFIEAVARELNMLYIRCKAGFNTNLRHVPLSLFDFPQHKGTFASTQVVFSLAHPLKTSITIPSGTVVAGGDLSFSTNQAISIPAGALNSAPVPVIAQAVGKEYNVGSHSITTIVSTLNSAIVAVHNDESASGGSDEETWAQYFQRFSEYIVGLQRTNWYGLRTAITAHELVRSCSCIEHFPPVDDLWNVTVYLEDGSGTISPALIQTIKEKIDGDNTGLNNGFRAPGINIRYKAPEIIEVSVEVSVYMSYDIRNDEIEQSIIKKLVSKQVQEYINRHKIGEDFFVSGLLVSLKNLMILKDVKIQSPTEDIPVGNNQIIRFKSSGITVGIVE
jgi:uncharacterized phage protein gp47/JayE